MTKEIRNIALLVLCAFGLLVGFLLHRLEVTVQEKKDLLRAQKTGPFTYLTKDSLAVAQAPAEYLTQKEFRQREEQLFNLIKSLDIRGRDVTKVVPANTKTEYKILTVVRDSVVYEKSHPPDTIQCLRTSNKWYALDGCIQKGMFQGSFNSVDSLVYIETVKRKRFLGFLWKQNKILNRRQEIVSLNPHTRILDVRFVSLE